jgi:hypothetical protein
MNASSYLILPEYAVSFARIRWGPPEPAPGR